MKNILMIRLREKDFKLKFIAMQRIYDVLDKNTFPERISNLMGSSFDHFNIDNQTEENCLDTIHLLLKSLINNQKKLNYQFRFAGLQIVNIEKIYPNLKLFVKDHTKFLLWDININYRLYFNKDEKNNEYVYIGAK